MVTTEVEQRAVTVSMAPPRRLLAPTRFRSFKMQPDRALWGDLCAPVQALIEDGWQVVAVNVAWGNSIPLAQVARERAARALTGCDVGVCQYGETSGEPGRGRTWFTLQRS